MKFLIGVLSLIVILATFGAPALFVFGWSGLSAGDRQAISKSIRSLGAGAGAELRSVPTKGGQGSTS